MCGRYTLHHTSSAVTDRFRAQFTLFEPGVHYNIAPQSDVAVILTDAGPDGIRALEGCRWGLVPSWADSAAIGARMINARAETLAERPAFRRLVATRRCIVPADGFYEWRRDGRARDPYYIRLRGGALFGIAGLWDEWQSPDGSPLRTCTIVTTDANGVVRPIHDRMPAILSGAGAEDRWLEPGITTAEAVLSLLGPYPDAEMEAIPVSRRVNSPAIDDPSLLVPDQTPRYSGEREELSLFP